MTLLLNMIVISYQYLCTRKLWVLFYIKSNRLNAFWTCQISKKKTCAFWAAFSLVQTSEGRATFTALLEPIKVGLKRVKICKSNLAARGTDLAFKRQIHEYALYNVILWHRLRLDFWPAKDPIWSISKYQALMFLLCIHIMLIILWTMHEGKNKECSTMETLLMIQIFDWQVQCTQSTG